MWMLWLFLYRDTPYYPLMHIPARKHPTSSHMHSPGVGPLLSHLYCWSTGWKAAPGVRQGGSPVWTRQVEMVVGPLLAAPEFDYCCCH